MSGKPRMSAKEKREKKKLLIKFLFQQPVIELACKKIGISRQMYYRWIKDDFKFSKEAERALYNSREKMNDLAESKLIGLVKDADLRAIMFWLQNNCKRYMKGEQYARRQEQTKLQTDRDDPARKRLNEIQKMKERKARKEGIKQKVETMDGKVEKQRKKEENERIIREHEQKQKGFKDLS